MSNGIWTATQGGERVQQSQFIRHRLLIVTPGTNGTIPADCASGFASVDPNTIPPGTMSPRGTEGGPHFVMSGETSDESHTYGFEFCLFTEGLISAGPALPAVGGYTVTIWVLIGNTQAPDGRITPIWASMAPNTGVNAHEMWHSFDVNAEAVRFQFGNLAADPTVNSLSLGIAFAEL